MAQRKHLQLPLAENIWLCCAQPADQGGETPIVDGRKVYERMDPAIRDRFMRHGIPMCATTETDLGSNGKGFRQRIAAAVENHCRRKHDRV